jgi:membrane-bound inhibitor of C-type lysozyme
MGGFFKRLSAVLVIAGMLALWGCASPKPSGKSSSKYEQPGMQVDGAKEALYISEKGALLSAYFDNVAGTVKVILPSGRTATLPRALSGSGARYSNGRETFWEHHGEATYWIGDKQVFQGKVKQSQ